MKKASMPVALLAAASILLSSCATPGGPGNGSSGTQADVCSYDYTASTALGAGAGALIGSQVSGRGNQVAGALIGALIGGIAAHTLTSYLERRCRALAAARTQMQSATLTYAPVTVKFADDSAGHAKPADSGIEVTVTEANATSEGMFAEGSRDLTPEGLHNMQLVAKVFQGTDRKVLIVGHTDALGTPDSNLKLSEGRALTVAKFFASVGIPAKQIYYKGAGETRPIDSNETPEGRTHNRRVQVFELQSEEGFIALDSSRDADPAVLARSTRPRNDARAVLKTASATPTKPAPQNPQTPAKIAGALPTGRQIAATRQGTRFDFGGAPVDTTGAPMAAVVGAAPKKGIIATGFSLISEAYASEPADAPLLDTACIADRFKKLGVIRSLATGEEVTSRIGDHMKGLFGTSWTKTLNGHLVSITEVSVMQESGSVDAPPHFFIFTNYKAGDQKPTMEALGNARAYIGEKGVLYRVFFQANAWPIRCADIVFSRQNPNEAAYGQMYYEKQGKVYGTEFRPTMVPK